jgi:O-antigen ligase/Flp pilus assembly protein TadD
MTAYNLSKIGRFLIYLSLFTPLFIIPFTLWEFVFVRNLIFYLLAGILFVVSFLYLYKNKYGFNFKLSPLLAILFVFLLARILSGIFGADGHQSFWGQQTRMDGNFGYVMLFGWLLAVTVFIDSRDRWLKFFKISVLTALIASVFSLIQPFFPPEWGFAGGKAADQSFFDYRLIGSLGNPIFFAGYILPHIFLGLYAAWAEKNPKKKIFWLFASCLFIFIVFSTGTRGAFISLVASGAVLLVAAFFRLIKTGGKKIVAAAVLGLPVLAAAALVFSGQNIFFRLRDISLDSSTAATRLMLWKIGLLGFADKWIFGWGPENFSYIFSKFYDPYLLRFSFYETWVDKPHNQFVEILAETGVFGALVFAAAIILLFRVLWRFFKKDKNNFWPAMLIFSAVLAYFGHIFFSFDTLESRITFFAILGFLSYLEIYELGKGRDVSSGTARAVFIVLIFFAATSFFFIGFGTIRASFFSSAANASFLENRFTDAKEQIKKLEAQKTPYMAGSWEFLADTILKGDAVGALPKTVSADVLPSVIAGLREAAGLHPQNFSYHYRLAQMYYLAGQYVNAGYLDVAESEALAAKKISSERQTADMLLAQIVYARRDLNGAIKILEELAGRNQNISQAYWYLGIFYDIAGRYEDSYVAMTTAADKKYQLQNNNERALYVKALGRFNDYARMAPVYEQMIEADKENPQWWANIAAVYLELKEYDKARKAARQAIFLSPVFGDEGEDFIRKVDQAESSAK